MSLEILPRHFVEKPWGQAALPREFGGRSEKVGEIWFDREDAPLPLLIKWLFTSEKLSVQVHPNDRQARARGLASGKEECWIVTATQGDARLGIGLTEALSEAELRDASLSGEIEQVLDWKPVKPGDWYYIPSGTIHAIGAGVQLVEIQQNADITYRLYDYGRPRELHLEDGVAVADTAAYAGAHGRVPDAPGLHQLVSSDYFSIHIARGACDLEGFGPAYCVPVSGAFDSPRGAVAAGEVMLGDPADLCPLEPGCVLVIARAS